MIAISASANETLPTDSMRVIAAESPLRTRFSRCWMYPTVIVSSTTWNNASTLDFSLTVTAGDIRLNDNAINLQNAGGNITLTATTGDIFDHNTTTADEAGRFCVPRLTVANYRLEATQQGFRQFVVEQVGAPVMPAVLH